MKPLVIGLFDSRTCAASLCRALDAESADIEMRRFPDDETYVRIDSDVSGRQVIIVCTLDRPNPKFVPLILIAATARDLGAERVGLVSPYLCYMRQDTQFRSGEGVTAAYFAKALGSWFDWLVTTDPHLHRFASLGEVYSIPTSVVHAAPSIAEWIRSNVEAPFLIGPDSESEQWVASVAAQAAAPHAILEKVRHGDRDVEISIPDLSQSIGRTPVLIDDIISSASTMIKTISLLRQPNLKAPICIGVHGIFGGDAFDRLKDAGPAQIVTCDTVMHDTNAIDLSQPTAAAVRRMLT